MKKLNSDRLLRRARRAVKKDEINTAEKLYGHILENYPMNQDAQKELAALRKRPVQSPTITEGSEAAINELNHLLRRNEVSQLAARAELLAAEYPNAHKIWTLLGIARARLEEHGHAIKAFEKSATLNSASAEAYNNLGSAHSNLGENAQAIRNYKEAIKLNPNFDEAYTNLAVVLYRLGDFQEAIEVLERSIAINSRNVKSINMLGTSLYKLGRFEESLLAYQSAVKLNPNFFEAHNNLASNLMDLKRYPEALEAFKVAISLAPDNRLVHHNFSIALQKTPILKEDPKLQETILSTIKLGSCVRPKDICVPAIKLLKADNQIKCLLGLVQRGLQGGDLPNVVKILNRFPLLLELLSKVPIPDLELEQAIKSIRSAFLLNFSDRTQPKDFLKVLTAIALQCFTNEYIYGFDPKDGEALYRLEEKIKLALKGGSQPKPEHILLFCSYKPLFEQDWAGLLTSQPAIETLLRHQLRDPREEKKLKQSIPTIGQINQRISVAVREQYEASPYPRWIDLDLSPEPLTIKNLVTNLKLNLVDERITNNSTPKILVAGCGTGQHPIATASRFSNCEVTAIDLSLSSLAYAKRKSTELGFKNIEFIHGDILNLSILNRKYDIIECSGVLHHMQDPFLGWQALTESLCDGGLMNIGLYSELARREITEIREKFARSEEKLSKRSLLDRRKRIIDSSLRACQNITRSHDFYSTSNLRDLIFHTHEVGFTIAKIKAYIARLNLNFCGLELPIDIVDSFSKAHVNELSSLDFWDFYERDNPDSFSRMYQFWYQKKQA